MKTPVNAFVIAGCAVALLAAMTAARAEQLADPTRPPDSPDHSATAPGVPAATGLQAIIRRHGRRPAAVINGEYVELGGRSGDARVVDIGEDSVTLQGATDRQTLMLAPGVEKKPADAPTGTKANRERKPSKGKHDN